MLSRSAFAPRRKNAGRPDHKSAPGFLQWLRGRPCSLERHPNHVCEGPVVAAHVDHGGDKGMGTKVSDKFCIPMCDAAHRLQHTVGWRTFETRFGFSALEYARQYWTRWPGRSKWEDGQ